MQDKFSHYAFPRVLNRKRKSSRVSCSVDSTTQLPPRIRHDWLALLPSGINPVILYLLTFTSSLQCCHNSRVTPEIPYLLISTTNLLTSPSHPSFMWRTIFFRSHRTASAASVHLSIFPSSLINHILTWLCQLHQVNNLLDLWPQLLWKPVLSVSCGIISCFLKSAAICQSLPTLGPNTRRLPRKASLPHFPSSSSFFPISTWRNVNRCLPHAAKDVQQLCCQVGHS